MSLSATTSPRPQIGSAGYQKFTRAMNVLMIGLCIGFTVFILSVLATVTLGILWNGFSSLSLNFFTKDFVDVPGEPTGMRNGLLGTAILIGIASAVGVPLGMLTGVYLSEYSANSKLATPVRFICDVLAGVPSIVVGILGYELVVRPIGNANGWAGAFAMAFIIIPIVARTTEEMLRLVPKSYREASIALGATKGRTILEVVIPAATGSLVTGVMLAIARVTGETAPLLLTTGFTSALVWNPSEQFPSLTVLIWKARTGLTPEQRDLAWAGILVLIALIFTLNLAIRYVTSRQVRLK
ncbi:MAG: phosphate ABC transporter permease PstA [Tepidisphaeraceae bacterium]